MPKKVIVLGGGVAGMSAAHELITRGFEVEVYEVKNIPGGKARSIDVPNSAKDGRKPLPGEHGFRFFPRFYKHVTDTMKHIPYGNNANGVLDNLVQADRAEMARYDKKPIKMITRFPRDLNDFVVLFKEIFDSDTGLEPHEIEFFAGRLWQLMTSCYERRLAEYEKISWWDFIEADGKSEAYQNLLAIGLTRTLVAAKAKQASARTGGDVLLQLMFDIAEPGESSDRLLDGPTNDVWVNPWLKFLKEKGVNYQLESTVKSINCSGEKITSATIQQGEKTFDVEGDYYIAAVPVEVMARLLNNDLLKADAGLATIKDLAQSVSWMNGIQFYLTKDVKIVHGHTIYINSEWALTSISQAQFWKDIDLANYGDGTIKGVLSVDISDWYTKGKLHNKPASQCTREEIKEEVWHQLKESLDALGAEVLKDEYLHTWFLDPDIVFPVEKDEAHQKDTNIEPLLVNKKDTWRLRPESYTAIPNFFLASDYVRTYTDLATMEGANEAARRAVNHIIDDAKLDLPKCELWKLHEPDFLELWRAKDKERFDKGLPWDGEFVGEGCLNAILKPFRKLFS